MTQTTGKRRRHRKAMPKGLTDEQKNFILRCLACGFSYSVMVEEFALAFERKLPVKSVISGYRTRYKAEIERMRDEWEDDLKSSGIPFARKLERVAALSRYAGIEDRRKRYSEAARHLRAIAEEIGDLKQAHDHSGTINIDDLSAEQRLDRLAAIAAQIEARAELRDEGGAETDRMGSEAA